MNIGMAKTTGINSDAKEIDRLYKKDKKWISQQVPGLDPFDQKFGGGAAAWYYGFLILVAPIAIGTVLRQSSDNSDFK